MREKALNFDEIEIIAKQANISKIEKEKFIREIIKSRKLIQNSSAIYRSDLFYSKFLNTHQPNLTNTKKDLKNRKDIYFSVNSIKMFEKSGKILTLNNFKSVEEFILNIKENTNEDVSTLTFKELIELDMFIAISNMIKLISRETNIKQKTFSLLLSSFINRRLSQEKISRIVNMRYKELSLSLSVVFEIYITLCLIRNTYNTKTEIKIKYLKIKDSDYVFNSCLKSFNQHRNEYKKLVLTHKYKEMEKEA